MNCLLELGSALKYVLRVKISQQANITTTAKTVQKRGKKKASLADNPKHHKQ